MLKKGVFADFDGTLSSGYLSMAFLEELIEQKLFHKSNYNNQKIIYKEYTVGNMSYDRWIESWAYEWAAGLNGFDESDLMRVAKKVVDNRKQHINPSSYDIMDYLKDKKHHLVLVSVGCQEVMYFAAKELNMDGIIATRCETKDGVYTGRLLTDLHTNNGKGDAVRIYAKNFGINLSKSIGLGDSKHDL